MAEGLIGAAAAALVLVLGFPVAASAAGGAPAHKRWVPPPLVEWQWELDHPLCNAAGNLTASETAALVAATVKHPAAHLACAEDLGIYASGAPVVAVDGATVPATDPRVYDIDAFDNTGTDNADEADSLRSSRSPVVAELHALGDHVICYVDVGTAENWRPDYAQLKGLLAGPVSGWPDERWISLAPAGMARLEQVMTRRFEMCRANRFDAVEPDNMDGSENGSGSSLAEQLRYDRWVAAEVHALGMSVAQKNFVDESAALVGSFDFVIDEQCFQYSECSELAPYTSRHRTVLEVEYKGQVSRAAFARACKTGLNGQRAALSSGLDSLYLSVNLDASLRVPCA